MKYFVTTSFNQHLIIATTVKSLHQIPTQTTFCASLTVRQHERDTASYFYITEANKVVQTSIIFELSILQKNCQWSSFNMEQKHKYESYGAALCNPSFLYTLFHYG